MGQPQRPCENCGASDGFVHSTPGGRKQALMRVITDAPSGRLDFFNNAGTPVDVFVCATCGLIRLFAVNNPVDIQKPT